MSVAGKCAIVAFVMWLVSGFAMFLINGREIPQRAVQLEVAAAQPTATGAVSVGQTVERVETSVNPDGTMTRKTITTITNADGSQTVTESVKEEPTASSKDASDAASTPTAEATIVDSTPAGKW